MRESVFDRRVINETGTVIVSSILTTRSEVVVALKFLMTTATCDPPVLNIVDGPKLATIGRAESTIGNGIWAIILVPAETTSVETPGAAGGAGKENCPPDVARSGDCRSKRSDAANVKVAPPTEAVKAGTLLEGTFEIDTVMRSPPEEKERVGTTLSTRGTEASNTAMRKDAPLANPTAREKMVTIEAFDDCRAGTKNEK